MLKHNTLDIGDFILYKELCLNKDYTHIYEGIFTLNKSYRVERHLVTEYGTEDIAVIDDIGLIRYFMVGSTFSDCFVCLRVDRFQKLKKLKSGKGIF